jgi:hypothetical protein
MAVLFESDPNGNVVARATEDMIMFTGTGNNLSLSGCYADAVFILGANQSVGLNLCGPDMSLYAWGSGINLEVGEPFYALSVIPAAQMTVYDFQHSATNQVTLPPFDTASFQTPDGKGGTWLSVGGPGQVLSTFGKIHFVYDPHVNVVVS